MAKQRYNSNSTTYGQLKDMSNLALLKSVFDTDGDGYIDATRIKPYVATLAGTNTFTAANIFTLPVTLVAPIAGTDAANKDYVDSAIAGGGDFNPNTNIVFTGDNDLQGTTKVITPVLPTEAANMQYVLDQVASVVTLDPDSANTWNGVQTMEAANIHNAQETFNGGVILNGGGQLDGTFAMDDAGAFQFETNIGEDVVIERSSTGMDINGSDDTAQLRINSVVLFPNLPTSDPGVAGQMWNSAGDLKISAG